MLAADNPTLEDVLAAAHCALAISRRHPATDMRCVAAALRRRARVAGDYRRRHSGPHPRFGDGSISAVSALALRRLRRGNAEVFSFIELLPAIAAVCSLWDQA